MPSKPEDYKLYVQIGSDYDKLEDAMVNDPLHPTHIDNDVFSGQVVVRVKGYKDLHTGAVETGNDSYFSETKDTSSVQFRGIIKPNVDGDQILFGNDFDTSIKESLPPGASIGLRALKWIDPALETDLYADKPWAFSPLLSTMNILNTTTEIAPRSAPFSRLTEDTSNLVGEHISVKQRRTHFANVDARKKQNLHEMYIQGDFSNPFIDFNTLSIALPYVNLHLNILQYWKGLF